MLHIISPSKSTAPSNAIAANVGTNIAPAISRHGRQPCPRKRIQATIGTVMVSAIP